MALGISDFSALLVKLVTVSLMHMLQQTLPGHSQIPSLMPILQKCRPWQTRKLRFRRSKLSSIFTLSWRCWHLS